MFLSQKRGGKKKLVENWLQSEGILFAGGFGGAVIFAKTIGVC